MFKTKTPGKEQSNQATQSDQKAFEENKTLQTPLTLHKSWKLKIVDKTGYMKTIYLVF